MHQQNVKLYGGPLHGTTVTVDRSQFRYLFRLADRPAWEMLEVLNDPHCRLDIVDLSQEHSYWIREIRQEKSRPRRFRSIWVGTIEGAELSLREDFELRNAIYRHPWQFPEVSFLDEFDEWMAQTMYRVCGYLEWKGRRVYG